MSDSFGSRLKHAWNAFTNKDPTEEYSYDLGPSYSYRPDRVRPVFINERTIIASVTTRIALDVSQISIQHVRVDENNRYLETIDSGLNSCFNLEANIDQTGKAFIRDVVESLLDEGVVALVPIDTSINPMNTNSFDILSMRTGRIVEWYPSNVRVEVYNDRSGNRETILLPKSKVAIVENPLYSVMNEPNSTYKRLVRKLNLLDVVDEQSSSGKLDMIIQLPYTIRSKARRDEAEKRRLDVEQQLSNTKYGIAYIDGTERITQLNRSVDNNLMKQIEYLTSMLYSQLGLTQEVFSGTASSEVMNNYYKQTIEPIVSAIVDEVKRKFLTKTARTQRQTILYFQDPFKFVPIEQIADMADKFTRNEIMTANEFRQSIGMKASSDPNADVLRNKNLSAPAGEVMEPSQPIDTEGDNQNGIEV